MIDQRRFEKILDRLENLANSVECMVCGSTITREEYNQLEDALQLIRMGYVVNVEPEEQENVRT